MKSVILVLALVAGVAQAQVVYKCPDGYQDKPCAGGRQIDVTDTPADPDGMAARMMSMQNYLSEGAAVRAATERQENLDRIQKRAAQLSQRASELAAESAAAQTRAANALERMQKYGVTTYHGR